jgi:hypothetical protein
MESGEGLANAVLHARMNAARRDAWGWIFNDLSRYPEGDLKITILRRENTA